MITNGSRMADDAFAKTMADAGLELVHVSVYSVRPEVEAQLRGMEGTLESAFGAMDAAHCHGIDVNVNCVINRLNADHLDENIQHYLTHHPYIRHFVWNNLDPSMGRAEVNQAEFIMRLTDFEASLHRALTLLYRSGRSFRVERVPLCYMTEFSWASTETRKIIKGEERIVHFLDQKQTVRQTNWEHIYSEACNQCSLRTICGGLFDRGDAFDPAELSPVFVSRDAIVDKVLRDPTDPSMEFKSVSEWKADFDARCRETLAGEHEPRPEHPPQVEGAPAVGLVTEQSIKRYAARREAEGRRADRLGIQLERDEAGKG